MAIHAFPGHGRYVCAAAIGQLTSRDGDIVCFQALGPTFYYTSVELGGWGWGVRSIAVLNTCFATSNAFWAAFGFHRTISRIGLTGGAMIGAYATLVPPVWYILSSVLLREGRKIAFYVCLILSSWSMSWMHPTGGSKPVKLSFASIRTDASYCTQHTPPSHKSVSFEQHGPTGQHRIFKRTCV